MAKTQAARTHCPAGHPYDETNTIRTRGRRVCKACSYARWRAAHPPTRIVPSTVERFWARFVKLPSGCWQWTGALDVNGYGTFSIDGRSRGAHQAAWKLLVGPIDNETIDHLCRNRGCVNPSHLEPASIADNVMRGESPPARNARKTHCPNGHEYTSENTYILPSKGWRRCRACTADYWRRQRRTP